jgi:hypothetical protein
MGNKLENESAALDSPNQKLVWDNATGQFKAVDQWQRVDADSQTEMLPSNIPNAR